MSHLIKYMTGSGIQSSPLEMHLIANPCQAPLKARSSLLHCGLWLTGKANQWVNSNPKEVRAVTAAKDAGKGNVGRVVSRWRSSVLFIHTNCISLPLKISMRITKTPLETTESYRKEARGWKFWRWLRKQPSPGFGAPHAFVLVFPFCCQECHCGIPLQQPTCSCEMTLKIRGKVQDAKNSVTLFLERCD